MPSAAKAKGSSWERELCQFLIETFGGNFQRVPNSGAFVGGANFFRKDFLSEKQARMFKGDVIPADHMPKLVIECKFYKDFQFHLLVKQNVILLDQWIEQTRECADANDVWFLCMKFNRKSSFILFEKKLMEHFIVGNHTVYNNFIFTDLESFLTINKDKILELTK